MRVHEFSKENNLTSKEVIELLQGGGFDVSSHMTLLDDEQLRYLMQAMKGKVSELEDDSQGVGIKKSVAKTKEKFIKKTAPVFAKKRIKSDQEIEAEEPCVLKDDPIVLQEMALGDLADRICVPSSEIILYLLRQGVVCNKNQPLSKDMVKQIADFYDKEVVALDDQKSKPVEAETILSDKQQERLPVVAVVGHVDHGKTTLLDYIRKTRVALRERGGITQHLGAYEAETRHGNIVFLDTPGHAAFSKIRMRGIKAADIVVLIIAAEDGVMPQTAEAIRHAKTMDVPIIVAINKIDKVDAARVEVVKGQLAKYDLVPEEWGGQTICVGISAKDGTGVDHLLEMISLQAQLMELKADPEIPARGYVLESVIEKGRGPVATVISQHGLMQVGDYFICGSTFGKINSLVDSYGNRVDRVAPSIPVRIAGFNDLAQVGDFFQVVSEEEFRKAKASKGKYRTPIARQLYSEDALGVIVKADTHASQEAVVESIGRLAESLKEHKQLYVIHAGVGDINESDVVLAQNAKAIILGFNVKLESGSAQLAQQQGVRINLFHIIYKLLDFVKEFIEKHKEVQMVLTKIGEAVVRRVFDIKGVGVIAGSYVKDGRFTRNCIVKAWRGNEFIGEGKIKSLQRDKKTVKEVHTGYECGFVVEGLDSWQVDDRAECYIEKPVE